MAGVDAGGLWDTGVCRRDMGAWPVGSACPDCGHTGQVHPHGWSPDAGLVVECLLCKIEELGRESERGAR